MYTEARELYNYVTNVEPFCSRLETMKNEGRGKNIFAIRQLVRDAIEQYCIGYANKDNEIFSNSDFYTVAKWIEADDEDFIHVYKFLTGRGIDDVNIIPPRNDISFRGTNNTIEYYGVKACAYEFVNNVVTKYIPEEKWLIEDIDNNLSSERTWQDGRGGRFDCHENIQLWDANDRYFIGAFCVTAMNVVAEIWDIPNDKIVAYVSIF